jgi:hypothetical protein
MEHAEGTTAPRLSLLVLCNRLVLADALHSIDYPRCVSAKNTCIFSRTLIGIGGGLTTSPLSRRQSVEAIPYTTPSLAFGASLNPGLK